MRYFLFLLLMSSVAFAGYSNVGTVSDVTASLPISSSGGSQPNITCAVASGSVPGCLSSSDWTSFNTGSSSATSATSANTVSTIVKRDSSGNFSAGTITATLSGTSTNFSGSLLGDVTGTQGASVVSFVGGSTAASVHSGELLSNAATSSNTASTIVKRDATGNFFANLPNSGFTLIDNFMSNTGAGNLGWSVSSSGSGSGTGAETTPIVSPTHMGVVGCYTGSTNSGRCSMTLGQQTMFGGGIVTVESEIDIPVLSTVSDEYIFRSGLTDSGTAAPAAGVWISYDRLNSGVNWQCNTAHSTSVSTFDSGVVMSVGWHRLGLVINAASTSADFYVDGVKVCTRSSNFPTTSDLLGIYPNGIFKSAGTTNTSTKIDYYYFNQIFTTPL